MMRERKAGTNAMRGQIAGVTVDKSESRTPIEFRTVIDSWSSGRLDATTVVIRSREMLVPLWNEHYSISLHPPEVPDIDFDKELILAAFLGQFPTTGYAIKVARMEKVKDRHGIRVVVRIHFHAPFPGDFTRQEFTSVNHWVAFPKPTEPQRHVPVHCIQLYKFRM